MSDRLDEISGKLTDLKCSVDTHIALMKDQMGRTDNRVRTLEIEMWDEPGKNGGLKAGYLELKGKEASRSWWHKAVGGTVVGLASERLFHLFKP